MEQRLADITRRLSLRIVEEVCPEERKYFDVIWDALKPLLVKRSKLQPKAELLRVEDVHGLGFAGEESPDLVTPVVVATVAETLRRVRGKEYSPIELQDIVGKTAAGFGASESLTGELTRHLPELCRAVLAVKIGVEEAHVVRATRPQYRIWTFGECITTSKSLSDYQKKDRNEYMFWLDLDKKEYMSYGVRRHLRDKAVKLLMCLVDPNRLGKRNSPTEVYKQVWTHSQKAEKLADEDRGLLQANLTELNNFSGQEFRDYLFHDKFEKGLGLTKDFADEDNYFIFERLR